MRDIDAQIADLEKKMWKCAIEIGLGLLQLVGIIWLAFTIYTQDQTIAALQVKCSFDPALTQDAQKVEAQKVGGK